MTDPQICTYVLRLGGLGLNVTSDEVRRRIQSFIGSEHEVMHVDRMQFESGHNSNTVLIQDVVQIKSPDPEFVARKLMEDDWTMSKQVFKTTGRPTALDDDDDDDSSISDESST
ncbi:hypothetical protein ACHAWC_000662 [Mediolabrus comicus]